MELFGNFTAVPAVAIICYVIAEGIKQIGNERLNKAIPVFMMVIGGILGAVCFMAFSGYIPGVNILEGIGTGIISGLAATGVNQAIQKTAELKGGNYNA